MDILKIIEALQSYSEDVVAYKLDSRFASAVTEAVKLLVEQGEQIAEMENNDIHLIKQRMVHEPGAGILHQALFEWCGKRLWLSLPIPKEG